MNRTMYLGMAALCGAMLSLAWQPSAAWAQETEKSPKVTTKVEVTDGKIVIVDENGEKREIDVSGAKSIVLSKTAEKIIRDGQEEVKSFGKAIVVGPDGEKIEIQLDGLQGNEFLGEKGALLHLSPMLEVFGDQGQMGFAFASDNKFYIGVVCAPVDETLAAHLGLTGTGLVVKQVTEESPAAEAGLNVNDILLNADDKELTSQQELSVAVNQAGENQGEVSLTVIREGKERVIRVKPAERKTGAAWNFEGSPKEFQWRGAEQLGPGIIRGLGEGELDAAAMAELMARMRDFDVEKAKLAEEMQARAQEMLKRLSEEQLANIPKLEALKGQLILEDGEALKEKIAQLTAELDAARAEMKAMKERLNELAGDKKNDR